MADRARKVDERPSTIILNERAAGEPIVVVLGMNEQADAELPQVVLASGTSRRPARRVDGRHQQRHQKPDDGDDNQ